MRNSILALALFGLVGCAPSHLDYQRDRLGGATSESDTQESVRDLTSQDGIDVWRSNPDRPYEIKETLSGKQDKSHCAGQQQCQPKIIPWTLNELVSLAKEKQYDFVYFHTIVVNEHDPYGGTPRRVTSLGIYTESI